MSRATMPILICKHSIPLWVLGAILISFCAGAFAVYTALTLRIPFSVTEPLEVTNYPQAINLYPGENVTLSVIILDHASQEYAVFLNFSLDTAILNGHATFSQENYVVVPGSQTLTAWVAVAPDAPSTNTILSVDIVRSAVPLMETEQVAITMVTFLTTPSKAITIYAKNSGTATVTINEVSLDNVTQTTNVVFDPTTATIIPNSDIIITITYDWQPGAQYEIKLVSAKGNHFIYHVAAPA